MRKATKKLKKNRLDINGKVNKKIVLFILLVLSLFVVLFAVSIQIVNHYAQVQYTTTTITYCKPGNNALAMDLYTPSALGVKKPMPLVIFVHGGGWISGSRGPLADLNEVERNSILGLLQQGFAVASIDYRLAPENRFPAMIQDVKCSIRFARANASVYSLDPNRIGLMGSSAGGHLVSLAGLADKTVGWDTGEFIDQPSTVNAVADLYGPADLTKPTFFNLDRRENLTLLLQVFGIAFQNQLSRMSPVSYISTAPNTNPPFLIVQGDKDTLVHPIQSQEFFDKLKANGQDATLQMVLNAGHGFTPVPETAIIVPTKELIVTTIVDFFVRKMAPSQTVPNPTFAVTPTFTCLGSCPTMIPTQPATTFTPPPDIPVTPSTTPAPAPKQPTLIDRIVDFFKNLFQPILNLFR